MEKLVNLAPLFRRRVLCCAGLAMLAASCGVREPTAPAGLVVQETPATPVTAHHLFVAQNGADTNPGTEAAPFKTIERASQVAQADTTVHVAPGTYAGGFKTVANGVPKARLYYLSTLRWGAKIVPPLNSANPTGWDNRGNYVDIVGFDVDGTVYQGGVKWLHGIYNGGSFDAIRGNHVHHIATTIECSSADGAGIGVDSYFRGIKSEVISNNIHDIGPAGCHSIQGIYINTSGTVANNIVYRAASAGIQLWRDANNVIVANNTVSASTIGIVVGAGDYFYTAGPNDHTHVSNNIVFDNKTGIVERGATGKNNTYANNLVFQNPGGDWQLANGLGHIGSVASAPQFLDYNRAATPDFRLSSTSPAIGKGSARHAQPSDFKGAPRNAMTGVDIGAFQH